MSHPALPPTPCLPPGPSLPPAPTPPQVVPWPQGIHDPFKREKANVAQVTSLSTLLQHNILLIPLCLLCIFNKFLHLNALGLVSPLVLQGHIKATPDLKASRLDRRFGTIREQLGKEAAKLE